MSEFAKGVCCGVVGTYAVSVLAVLTLWLGFREPPRPHV